MNVKICCIGICGVVECFLIYKDIVDMIGIGVLKVLIDVGVCVYVDEVL